MHCNLRPPNAASVVLAKLRAAAHNAIHKPIQIQEFCRRYFDNRWAFISV